MRRLLLLATALVTFLAGVTVSRLLNATQDRNAHYQFRLYDRREYKPRILSDCKRRRESEFKPLQVILDSEEEPANKQIPYPHRFALVTNVGTIPIRYYVLGFGTDRSNVGTNAFMTENGFTYTQPDLSLGPLMPAETRTIPIRANAEFSEEALVWVDYLEFEDGFAWGPNRSRTLQINR